MALISSGNFFSKKLLTYSIKNKISPFCCALHRNLNLRCLSSGPGLVNTTILMQSGMDIHELPLVIKKISSKEASQVLFFDRSSKIKQSNTAKCNGLENCDSSDIQDNEIKEIIFGFKNCNSFNEILKLLETVPSDFINPSVAIHIFKKIVVLESNNMLIGANGTGDNVSKNFTRTAIFNQLMGIILSSKESSICIECLKLMNENSVFKKYLLPFEEKLNNVIMINVAENKFSIENICAIVKEFHALGKVNDIDKLWVGVTENFKEININNIMSLFHILPYFKNSRRIIGDTLEKKIFILWWNMNGKDISEIFAILKESKTYSYKLLEILARWLNTKIHSVTEDELLLIVNGFKDLNFFNLQIITALQRFMKTKGMKVQNTALISGIMDYCLHFRIRSSVILEKCCNYFITFGDTLPPSVITSLFCPFGNLNYSPERSYEFWKKFEEILADKLSYFCPEQVLEIMLACIYLEKYPINFVNTIFNPYFLNRLQYSSKNWNIVKKKLRLFDHTMTLECKAYQGPLLPTAYNDISHLSVDARVQHALQQVKNPLISIVNSEERIIFSKTIRNFPYDNLYLIDALIIPEGEPVTRAPYNFMNRTNKDLYVAILIHVPEHYDTSGKFLIGPQIMRIRHLEKIGLKVVSLNSLRLGNLNNNFKEMKSFLSDSIHAS